MLSKRWPGIRPHPALSEMRSVTGHDLTVSGNKHQIQFPGTEFLSVVPPRSYLTNYKVTDTTSRLSVGGPTLDVRI